MYFHPLQEEIGNMSEEEISNRIKELSRKVAIARRGRNPEMLQNLQLALNTYRDAIRQRRIEEWHKNNKKLRNEPDIGDLINID
jgi:DNA-binding Lrp family transcriptional regulator